METQKTTCATDQTHLQHYSLPPLARSPPFLIPPHLQDNFDLLAMHTSPSSSDKSSVVKDTYFSSPVSTSGRQRAAQACDKCRERKTKCSGEKPVCQRCTNRGLICEYSYREPRVRGPARARVTSSTASSAIEDSTSKAFPPPILSRLDLDFPRPRVTPRNYHPAGHALNNYTTSSIPPRHRTSPLAYLGTESRSYSEPRATHLPHWTDVRPPSGRSYSSSELGLMDYTSSQPQMTLRDTGGIGYDPYSTLRQPLRRQDPLLGSIPTSSTFLLEAQESQRYDNGDLSNYDYNAGNIPSECQLSSSSDSSGTDYQSNSTLSSSTSTPPFYALDTLENSSSDSHSRPMTNDLKTDMFRKRVYPEEETAGLLDFSYGNKEFVMREDWRIGSDSNKAVPLADSAVNTSRNEQQSKSLLGSLWQNDIRQAEVDFGYQSGRGGSIHCVT